MMLLSDAELDEKINSTSRDFAGFEVTNSEDDYLLWEIEGYFSRLMSERKRREIKPLAEAR